MLHPIHNVLFGDLITLGLIQVQQQKVELARAMVALAKLMRANGMCICARKRTLLPLLYEILIFHNAIWLCVELNFQLMALFPAVLVVGGGFYQLHSILTRNRRLQARQAAIRRAIRDVERLLNRSSAFANVQLGEAVQPRTAPPLEASYSNSLPAWLGQEGDAAYHLKLYEVGQLLVLLNDLFLHGKRLPYDIRANFLEDLSDLSSNQLTVRAALCLTHSLTHA